MDGKNLALKFAVLLIAAALCVGLLVSKGLKQGVDLRGGHSLVYEIITNKAKIKELKSTREQISAALKALSSSSPSFGKGGGIPYFAADSTRAGWVEKQTTGGMG